MNIAFYLSGAIAVAATFMVITRLNAIHALLYLIVSLLAVAVTFFTLGAPFVAALEVVIYAGAIMVLFVFVVMLLNLGQETVQQERAWLSRRAWIGPGIMLLILFIELVFVLTQGTVHTAAGAVAPQEVAIRMYRTYALGVELASMLLLVGLVVAYHIGRRGDEQNRLDAISARELRERFVPAGHGTEHRGE